MRTSPTPSTGFQPIRCTNAPSRRSGGRMASAPSEPRPIIGRIDKAGRLVAADPELENLQRQAGSALGQRLAIPQIAAVAELARKLGISVTRPAVAASADHDIELCVQATPEGDEVVLSLQGWT